MSDDKMNTTSAERDLCARVALALEDRGLVQAEEILPSLIRLYPNGREIPEVMTSLVEGEENGGSAGA